MNINLCNVFLEKIPDITKKRVYLRLDFENDRHYAVKIESGKTPKEIAEALEEAAYNIKADIKNGLFESE